MNAPKESLDDAECDKASDIDPTNGLRVVDCPLVNGKARSKGRVEFEKDGPRWALVVWDRSAMYRSLAPHDVPGRVTYNPHSSDTLSSLDIFWIAGLTVYMLEY